MSVNIIAIFKVLAIVAAATAVTAALCVSAVFWVWIHAPFP